MMPNMLYHFQFLRAKILGSWYSKFTVTSTIAYIIWHIVVSSIVVHSPWLRLLPYLKLGSWVKNNLSSLWRLEKLSCIYPQLLQNSSWFVGSRNSTKHIDYLHPTFCTVVKDLTWNWKRQACYILPGTITLFSCPLPIHLLKSTHTFLCFYLKPNWTVSVVSQNSF